MMGRNPYTRPYTRPYTKRGHKVAIALLSSACALLASAATAQQAPAAPQPGSAAVRPARPDIRPMQTASLAAPDVIPAAFDATTNHSSEHETCDKVKVTRCSKATIFVFSTPSVEIPNVPVAPGTNAKPASGSTVTYYVTATNNGPALATGFKLVEGPRTGVTCPANGPVVIASGKALPRGNYTIADLTGPGLTLPTLDLGQSTTLTYSCQVN